ncbi:putative Integumentary mucin C.1 [Hypsibius exemplaris]|uniref:Integumentary mucin C.1 n=1 Tax=Hypsibius exemplaris TaxID=2072580 RepID=A0A9X6RJT7_HYPEX|nr:putative Integumentary mucin C.1 [Hypsibius exemplaris]
MAFLHCCHRVVSVDAVIWGGCNVPGSSRTECGFPGITASACQAQNCCFDDSKADMKWCFHSRGSMFSGACNVPASRRKDCGFPGITQSKCLDRMCCYDTNAVGIIQCFSQA